MVFLVKLCSAEISGQQHPENGPFAPFFQSDLLRPLKYQK
jgi:hypothetical protein